MVASIAACPQASFAIRQCPHAALAVVEVVAGRAASGLGEQFAIAQDIACLEVATAIGLQDYILP